MDIRHYFETLRRWWWLCILLIILGGGVSLAGSFLRAPTYESSTTLLINPAPGTLISDADAIIQGQRVSSTYAELIHQGPILEKVIEDLGLGTSPADLDEQITVVGIRDTNLLEVRVRDSNPERAATIANTIVQVFVEENNRLQSSRYTETLRNLETELERVRLEITNVETQLAVVADIAEPQYVAERERLQLLLAEYQSTYATLLDRYESARLAESQTIDLINVVETAQPATTPIGIGPVTAILSGLLIGAVIGLGSVVVIDYLDDSIMSSNDIRALTGLAPIAVIGQFPTNVRTRLISIVEPQSAHAEAFRVLNAHLGLAKAKNQLRRILVTSSGPREGKSTIASNLAVAMAQAGKSVLLVDGDLRRPSLYRMFRVKNDTGLSLILSGQISLQGENGGILRTDVDNLDFLASGPLPPNPTMLLQSSNLANLVSQFDEYYDTVIIDSSPILAVADSTILAEFVDGVLVVARHRQTRIDMLKSVVEQLEQTGTPMVGVVYNDAQRDPQRYYYYDKNYK